MPVDAIHRRSACSRNNFESGGIQWLWGEGGCGALKQQRWFSIRHWILECLIVQISCYIGMNLETERGLFMPDLVEILRVFAIRNVNRLNLRIV